MLHFGQNTHENDFELSPDVLVSEGRLLVESSLCFNEILVIEYALLAEEAILTHVRLDFILCLALVFEFDLQLRVDLFDDGELGQEVLGEKRNQLLEHGSLLLGPSSRHEGLETGGVDVFEDAFGFGLEFA